MSFHLVKNVLMFPCAILTNYFFKLVKIFLVKFFGKMCSYSNIVFMKFVSVRKCAILLSLLCSAGNTLLLTLLSSLEQFWTRLHYCSTASATAFLSLTRFEMPFCITFWGTEKLHKLLVIHVRTVFCNKISYWF